jgi:uncharacterized protein
MNLDDKYNSLKKTLKSFGKVAIAYSGGVDSTFLLKAAVDTLGAQNVLACIGISPSLGRSPKKQALELAKTIGADLHRLHVRELDDPAYSDNRADRCFHCKSHLYGLIVNIAKEHNIAHVLCGSNFDDKDDFRPGSRAAKVFGVHAPLAETEMTKTDIRELSRRLDLPTAEAPAWPCLASRISYGLKITENNLKQIDQAEDLLRSLGFIEFRVRHHGDIARIEVPSEEIEKITAKKTRNTIINKLKALGFKYVTLDLQGFRSGSLNETLTEEEKQKHK